MAALVMAGTLSKDPVMYGLPPQTCVIGAIGAELVLDTGKSLVDYCSGLGTNLLGYGITGPLHSNYAPSLPHYLEYEVADKLAALLGSHVPGWQPDSLGVRFCKTGSDATTMAVRLARAVTGRQWVITFRDFYHGWHDWTISRTAPAHGVVGGGTDRATHHRVMDKEWGNEANFFWRGNAIAAVIFEQPAIDPPPGWYAFLRRWCNDNGVFLIADETVTALRYGMGGACERYGVEPDLVCMGKALGNGVSCNALIGRRDYMDWFARTDPVFCSSTYWGETSGLAAANWVLDNWTPENVTWLWAIGEMLIDGLKATGWDVFGHGARSVLRFESEVERAWFIQGMIERSFLFNRPNFPCLAHTVEDVRQVIIAARQVRQSWEATGPEEAAVLMAGKLPRVLFANR